MTEHHIVGFHGQAEGAWPNGTTVAKANSQPDDGTPDGTLGRIIGSIDVSTAPGPARFGYFVAWTTHPRLPVFTVDTNNDGSARLEQRP